jgi:hypothetical protein
MAPFMMAFSPAEPGRHHPAPWSAVSGGLSFDIHVQLEVPYKAIAALSLPPEFVPWWITALLRLRIAPVFVVPVVGEQSFEEAKEHHDKARYYPIETNSKVLSMTTETRSTITELDAAWVAKHWVEASHLFNQREALQMLFESVDQSMFARHRDLALLWLWGGLEALFSSDKMELKYRISTAIASFLEPAGLSRMTAQKRIAKLYDSRSAAAHGREDKQKDSLQQTYNVARRVVIKIIEDNRVPTNAELEAKLFGADPL